MSREKISSAIGDDHPSFDAEAKPSSWGRIEGRVLAIDYGLPSRELVEERRKYYAGFDVELG